MFSVTIRDHMMIAHSLPGRRVRAGAAPARCDLRRGRHLPTAEALDADNIVVDIGRATEELHAGGQRAELPQP